MDDFSAAEVSNLGASLAQLGSDNARRLCEQSQDLARVISQWNTEVGRFASHRVTRNLDTIARITKCGNLHEAFSIQTEWLRDATDDYVKEIGTLMVEINGKIVSGALQPGQEAAVQAAERARSSVKAPIEVSN